MLAFFESPANRHGLAVLASTAFTAILQYITLKHIPYADILGIIIGIGLILVPDNSVTIAQLTKATSDISTAINTKSPIAIESALSDAAGIVKSVIDPANSTPSTQPTIDTKDQIK